MCGCSPNKRNEQDIYTCCKCLLIKRNKRDTGYANSKVPSNNDSRRSANLILHRYPKTKLEMKEEERKYKWGKYGKGMYVYPDVKAKALQAYLEKEIARLFPQAKIEYFT
ncbi:hypothetical protein AN963_04430 [Brevibacillus choshinensis]|uniref:Uncharacterized protein n=1 Tax=Brevibacillus choshinensis TaxID=54911 RepID=A0ABR5NBV0_BRECH|nr:hypothetical protein AN963_04430 [Brevibacillus choshinensis]